MSDMTPMTRPPVGDAGCGSTFGGCVVGGAISFMVCMGGASAAFSLHVNERVGSVLIVLCLLACVAALVVRYRRTREPFTLGLVIGVAIMATLFGMCALSAGA